ncbi:hypothetical protein F5148DRAFT_1283448 [Russula earlei]|uniref:Uncharacterized protein n=1 Tax=Russula earlei TaxID=71964 RepID=A0ACC0UBP0_9AGAM|nr:hypothetical protein F5148DRAFT_1283448 [Russula earlei]
MVQLSNALMALLAAASASSAVSLQKRVVQQTPDSTLQWMQACTTASGGDVCNTVSQVSATTLLATASVCDQQDAADTMIDVAKTLKSNPDMIRLAQIFVQQPRDAADGLQVPHCQKGPRNTELHGLYHCQFASSDFTKFSGDQKGNLPPNITAVNPPGSCPALNSPVPDGVQLYTLVSSPGAPSGWVSPLHF